MKLSSFYLSCSWFLLCIYFSWIFEAFTFIVTALQLCAVASLLTSVAATPPSSVSDRASCHASSKNSYSYVINVEYSVVYCLGTFYSNVVLHPCLVHVDIKNFNFNSLNLIDLNWSQKNNIFLTRKYLKCFHSKIAIVKHIIV
jgi:hypothetical protein